MKRMALIAIVLCALMLGTLGAGVVAAKQEKAPTPADAKHFDVTLNDKVVGKLILNIRQLTYTFNGHGLDPGETYYLLSKTVGTDEDGNPVDVVRSLGSADAAADGTVSIQGDASRWLVVFAANPTFTVSTTAPPVQDYPRKAVLTAYWSKTIFATWKIWGKLQDAETGLPIADAPIYFKMWKKDGGYADWKLYYKSSSTPGGYYTWPLTTDDNGEFKYKETFNVLRDPKDHPPGVMWPGGPSPLIPGVVWEQTEVWALPG